MYGSCPIEWRDVLVRGLSDTTIDKAPRCNRRSPHPTGRGHFAHIVVEAQLNSSSGAPTKGWCHSRRPTPKSDIKLPAKGEGGRGGPNSKRGAPCCPEALAQ